MSIEIKCLKVQHESRYTFDVTFDIDGRILEAKILLANTANRSYQSPLNIIDGLTYRLIFEDKSISKHPKYREIRGKSILTFKERLRVESKKVE